MDNPQPDEVIEALRIEALREQCEVYVGDILSFPGAFSDTRIDLLKPLYEDPTAQAGLAPDEELDLQKPPEDMPSFPVLTSAQDYEILRAIALQQLGLTEEELKTKDKVIEEEDPEITHTLTPAGWKAIEPYTIHIRTNIYKITYEGQDYYLRDSVYPPGHLDPKVPDLKTALAIGPLYQE